MPPVDRLKLALYLSIVVCPLGILAQSVTTLKGAGATFPYPIYAKWIANYCSRTPGVQITYDPIGSEAGFRKLLNGSVDFGASDNPQILSEAVRGDQQKFLLFPSVIGAVVPIVNLPGFTHDVAFTPEILAGIYLGKITKWDDPLIKQANRRLHLPDLDIVVVHRADGSGTSYTWTDYLSQTNPEWKQQVGVGLSPKWPVGRGANGSEGVAKLVMETKGAIGYVEFIYALRNRLSFGSVRNEQGKFVTADLDSIEAAATASAALGSDFKGSIVNAPAPNAYPITSFSWLIVPAHPASAERRDAMIGFLKWMLGSGQRQAAALGYVALPPDLVSREEAALSRIR